MNDKLPDHLRDAYLDLLTRNFALEVCWTKLTADRPDLAEDEFKNITDFLTIQIQKETPNWEKVTQDFNLHRIDILEKYLPGEMKKFRQALGRLLKTTMKYD